MTPGVAWTIVPTMVDGVRHACLSTKCHRIIWYQVCIIVSCKPERLQDHTIRVLYRWIRYIGANTVIKRLFFKDCLLLYRRPRQIRMFHCFKRPTSGQSRRAMRAAIPAFRVPQTSLWNLFIPVLVWTTILSPIIQLYVLLVPSININISSIQIMNLRSHSWDVYMLKKQT